MLSQHLRITSRKQIWAILVLLTLVSILVSLTIALIALKFTTTGDADALHPEHEIYDNVILFAILIPAIACPLVVYTLLTTLHGLTLARSELDAIAWKDPLTGLLNRRGFDEASAQLIAQAKLRRMPVTAMMCDIDSFKHINDTHGHDCGDAAIRHVCDILITAQGAHPDTTLGRQGGEEFAIMTIGKSPCEIARFTEDIRSAVEASPIHWEGTRIQLTVSLGVSTSSGEEASVPSLMSRADKALYETKKHGKNRVHGAGVAA
jgi:diguanylate cyclase (GGDEF)-like protein